VVGPTLGGLFSEFLSWRWIFFVNIPLCIAAAWLIVRFLHETVERTRHRIDWAGGALLTVSMSLLILGLLEGGNAWAWNSPQSVGAFVVGTLLLVAFVRVEHTADEPVLPLWVFSRRLLLAASLIAVAVGVILIGLTSYVPSFLEALLHVSPLASGLALAALTIGWPITASQSGRLYLRFGFRTTALVGSVIAVLGVGALVWISTDPTLVGVGAACFVVGAGLGLTSSPTLIAAQSSVGWGDRGVVTGANLFARSMGSAVGVAVLGAVVNARMDGLDPGQAPEQFGSAVTAAFVVVLVVALAMVVAAAVMPRATVEHVTAEATGGH